MGGSGRSLPGVLFLWLCVVALVAFGGFVPAASADPLAGKVSLTPARLEATVPAGLYTFPVTIANSGIL